MQLTYIYHSGFILANEECSIIFDYYRDSDIHEGIGITQREILKKKAKVYVFSSHSHLDHFNPEVLEWRKINPDIKYIFSKEILDEGKAKAEDAFFLDKLDVYKDDFLSVKAFGSTDIGGSFLLTIGDKTIFHAGDLNNWHWNEESSKEESIKAELFYLDELKILSDNVSFINIAMFPVDPRLGKDYMKGAEQFLNAINVEVFVPMHFGSAYQEASLISEFAQTKGCKCICWTERGEQVNLEL